MGNCLERCFGKVNTKRNKYFTGRYNNSKVDIEFENLIEDDDVQQNHAVLTEEERNHLLNHRYTDLVSEQQRVDARLDRELAQEEENARLEEEAYNSARREAARAAHQARELETQRSRPQKNGSAKSWLGSDAGDWEIATEDDFETFLETVKAKSETVRASVASMLNTNTTTTTTTTSFTTNPIVTNQPTSPSIKTVDPTATVDPKAAFDPKWPTGEQTLGSNSGFNSQATQGGKLWEAPVSGSHTEEGLVGVEGQVTPGQVSDRPDDLPNDAGQRSATGEGSSDRDERDEGSGRLSRYIGAGHDSSNHSQAHDDDSDVEWEADFVSADSTPEPIRVPSSTSSSKSSSKAKPFSSSNSIIPAHSDPIKTGLPALSRTNGSTLANGRLPYKQEDKPVSTTSKTTSTSSTKAPQSQSSPSSAKSVKPKKTLDIDIEKFLEELDFE